MANNIALTLTLDGVQQTITTIGQLETAIKQAKEQLSGLEINSQEFKNLTTQIRQADSALKNLQENIEGKKIEETVGRYAKIGSAITGSFAAAQAAISLFGSESEEVTKAAAQAQNLLTIALVGREVAEGSVAGATLIADLATQAQTTSTLAADSATKRFYATLAANPYTALLVGVGLLITAVVAFGSATDDSKKKSKEFSDQVNKDSAKEITATKLLIQTVNDQTLSINTRQKAVDDLRGKFPAYFKDLKDEDILSGKVKIATNQLTEAIIRQAQARALQGRIEERAVKLLDLEEKITKAQKDQVDAQNQLRNQGTITGGGSLGGVGGAGVSETASTQRLATATNELNRLRKEQNNINKENATDTKKILDLNRQTDSVIGTQTKTIEGNTGAQNKNNESKKDGSDIIEKQLQFLQDQNKLLEDEFNIKGKLGEADEKILEELKKRVELAKSLANEVKNINTNFKDGLQETLDQTTQLKDEIGVSFTNLSLLLTGQLEGADVVKQIDFIFDKTTNSFQKVEKEIKVTSENIGNAYKNVFDIINKNNLAEVSEVDLIVFKENYEKLGKDVITIGKEFNNKYQRDVVNFLLKQREIILDPYETQGVRTAEQRQQELLNVDKNYTKTRSEIIKRFYEEEVAQEKKRTGLKKLDEKVLEQLNENAIQRYDRFLKTFTETLEFEQGVSKVILGITEINDVLSKLTPEQVTSGYFLKYQDNLQKIVDYTYKGIVVSGDQLEEYNKGLSEKIIAIDKDLTLKRTENYGEYALDIEDLDKQLQAAGLQTQNLTQETKLTLLKGFLQKQIDETSKGAKQTEDVEKSSFQKRIDNLTQFLQDFQGLISQVGQLTSDYYSGELSKLDKQNEQITKKIVGDTERANQLRLEQEEIYNRKKAQLEKQAAKTALQISLVQAIANTAEAVTKALTAGPVSGQILAGISAGIGAIQIGLITKQLSEVDSYQRGGMIKGQGGMVVGPSHEYGGVKFQGGGVELEGGEAVINRISTIKYAGLLNQINQNGGGRPISVTNFDDSRIVEALSKQKSEPLRAYVVESDITDKQQITRRLERLSQI
jgi:hypothetical protein